MLIPGACISFCSCILHNEEDFNMTTERLHFDFLKLYDLNSLIKKSGISHKLQRIYPNNFDSGRREKSLNLLIECSNSILTLIWVSFLKVRFEVCVCVCVCVGGEGGNLKLVRIMLETRTLVHMYTHICSFKKYIF